MAGGLSLLLPAGGRALLLLLCVATTQSHWPSDPAEAAKGWEDQLEASMHSVLSGLPEAAPTVAGIPDGTAVVGRVFRVTIPADVIASDGEVIKVSRWRGSQKEGSDCSVRLWCFSSMLQRF